MPIPFAASDFIAALFRRRHHPSKGLPGKGAECFSHNSFAVGGVAQVVHHDVRSSVRIFNTFRVPETVIFDLLTLLTVLEAYGLIYSPLHSATYEI